MRRIVVMCLFGLLFHQCDLMAGERWEKQGEMFDPSGITCINACGDSLIIATKKYIYIASNGEAEFSKISANVSGAVLNDVILNDQTLYAATDNGIYKSVDSGKTWHRTFKGAFDGEKDLISINITDEKFFVSSPTNLYVSLDKGNNWTRNNIFNRDAGTDGTEDMSSDDTAEGAESESVRTANKINVDANGRITAATSKGMIASDDQGKTWRDFDDQGLFNVNVFDCLCVPDTEGRAYAATENGIFEYTPSDKTWTMMTWGLSDAKILGVSRTKNGDLFCVSQKNLYKNCGLTTQKELPTVNVRDDEPTFDELRQVAIDYADVGPEKINRWKRDCQTKALLPTVSFGIDHDTNDNYEIYTSASTNYTAYGPKENSDGWDVRFSWSLGDIVYNEHQTSIDSRSKLMSQLREDILSSLTRFYFERKRIKKELENSLISKKETLWEKKLRLEELTASIDSLTGGWFSRRIQDPECKR